MISTWSIRLRTKRGLVLFNITRLFSFLFPRDGKLFSKGKKLPYVTSCNVKLMIEIYNGSQTIFQKNENRNVIQNLFPFLFGNPFSQLQKKKGFYYYLLSLCKWKLFCNRCQASAGPNCIIRRLSHSPIQNIVTTRVELAEKL